MASLRLPPALEAIVTADGWHVGVWRLDATPPKCDKCSLVMLPGEPFTQHRQDGDYHHLCKMCRAIDPLFLAWLKPFMEWIRRYPDPDESFYQQIEWEIIKLEARGANYPLKPDTPLYFGGPKVDPEFMRKVLKGR